MYAGVFVVFAFSQLFRNDLGPEIWFHLENGRSVLENPTISHSDPILQGGGDLPSSSLSNFGWAFGVLSRLIFQAGGVLFLDLFRVGMIGLMFFFMIALSLRRRENCHRGHRDHGEREEPGNRNTQEIESCTSSEKFENGDLVKDRGGAETDLNVVFLILPLLMAAFVSICHRPELGSHLVSSVFLAFFAWFLSGPVSRAGLIAAAGLMVVWANSDGMLVVGMAFVILRLGQDFLESRVFPETQGNFAAPLVLISIGGAAILCSPASDGLLTETGEYYALYLSVFRSAGLFVPGFEAVQDSRIFHGFLIFLGLGCIGLLYSLVSDRRGFLSFLPVLPFLSLPWISVRLIAPGVILLFPSAFRQILSLWNYLENSLPALETGMRDLWETVFPSPSGGQPATVHVPNPVVQGIRRGILLILFPLSFWILAPLVENDRPPYPLFSGTRTLNLSYDRNRRFPENALRFLIRNNLGGTLFCPLSWGGFASAYRQEESVGVRYRPFIHGMWQRYDVSLLVDYAQLFLNPKNMDQLVKKYQVEIALFRLPDSWRDGMFELIQHVHQRPDWKLVYWDDVSILYISQNLFQGHGGLKEYSAVNPALFKTQPESLPRSEESRRLIEEFAMVAQSPEGKGVLLNQWFLARVSENGGETEGTVNALKRALEIAPEDFVTLQWMGRTLAAKERYAESISYLERALKVNGRDVPLLYDLAVVCLHGGKPEAAISFLERALDLYPTFEKALSLRKEILQNPLPERR